MLPHHAISENADVNKRAGLAARRGVIRTGSAKGRIRSISGACA